MDLMPTPEQSEIVDTIRVVLERELSPTVEATFDRHAPEVDKTAWAALGELGWFALGLDEAHGGVGYGAVEEALLHMELGRFVAPGPFLAQTMAAHLAADGDGDVGAIASGTAVAAWAEFDGRSSWTTFGGAAADVMVLSRDGALALCAADKVTTTETIPSLDPATPLHRATVADGVAVDNRAATDRANLLVAAFLAGIATATAEQSTSYAKDRHQFGQPIGSFQAVKHRCADMATRAEAARSQVAWAAISLRDGADDLDLNVSAARVMAQNAAITNAEINVQNHGGIGFTWEHPAHRYVTRARTLAVLVGGNEPARRALLNVE